MALEDAELAAAEAELEAELAAAVALEDVELAAADEELELEPEEEPTAPKIPPVTESGALLEPTLDAALL